MCTALNWHGLFGRNLDLEYDLPGAVTLMPRRFPLPGLPSHYALLGMAWVKDGFPLYFDAINDAGLGMVGLHFPRSAHYSPPAADRDNVPSWLLMPWLLGQCASVDEVRVRLPRLQITDEAFSSDLPPSPLHWMVADRKRSLVLEVCRDGLHWYDAPAGVLTNEPPFPVQTEWLARYRCLSPAPLTNTLLPETDLPCSSRGTGSFGLPGDMTSASRFVRAVFGSRHAAPGRTPQQNVAQFFHILDSVAQLSGCVILQNGRLENTRYSSCCDLTHGIYRYKTYWDPQVRTFHLVQTDTQRLQILQTL